MKISFLMPAHNSGEFIERALRSTLGLMHRGDELIVVNDASTDGTTDILCKFDDPRLVVLTNGINLGVANSLNRGLSVAVGDLIARIDADDICLPWRRLVQLRLQTKTDSDFIFSSALLYFDRTKLCLPQRPDFVNSKNLSRKLIAGNPFVHSSMMAKRSTIEELGGYRNVAAEDYDLWLRSLTAGKKIIKGNIPTVVHRIHPKQLTKTSSWQERLRSEDS